MRQQPGRNRVVFVGAVFVTLGLVCVGCIGSQAQSPEPSPAPLTRGEFERSLLLTGELEAVRSISIKSPQTNMFQMRIQFMAEEGSFVQKGDPLLDFDNSALAEQVRDLESRILDAETQIVSRRNQLASELKDLEIQVAEAEFEYRRAELEVSIDPEVVSRKEYAERELALTKGEEELAEIRDRIGLTRQRGMAEVDVLVINRDKLQKDLLAAQQGVDLLSIEAPADGLVVFERRRGTTLRFQEGDSCWPGQAIIRLPDLSEMHVVFRVSEVDAPLLEVGLPVVVSLDAFPGRQLVGRIERIPSMAVKRDENSKVAIFNVVASLEETWVGEMKPGMSTLGRVVIDRQTDAPRVARDRVRFESDSYWFRPAGSGRPPVKFAPLARNDRYYLVTEEDFARLGGSLGETASASTRGGDRS